MAEMRSSCSPQTLAGDDAVRCASGSHRTPVSPQRPASPSPVRRYPEVSECVPRMICADSTRARAASPLRMHASAALLRAARRRRGGPWLPERRLVPDRRRGRFRAVVGRCRAGVKGVLGLGLEDDSPHPWFGHRRRGEVGGRSAVTTPSAYRRQDRHPLRGRRIRPESDSPVRRGDDRPIRAAAGSRGVLLVLAPEG